MNRSRCNLRVIAAAQSAMKSVLNSTSAYARVPDRPFYPSIATALKSSFHRRGWTVANLLNMGMLKVRVRKTTIQRQLEEIGVGACADGISSQKLGDEVPAGMVTS